jgi:hypothetical protein
MAPLGICVDWVIVGPEFMMPTEPRFIEECAQQ